MAMNRVQFQPGLSLPAFLELFGAERQCEAALEKTRWPEGVYLTSIKQSGQVVLVSGLAQTNERVSEFLRNTLYNSPWLEKPELVEIKTAASGNSPTAAAATRDGRRLNEFSMRLNIKRPAPAADAASAPADAAAKKAS